MFPADPAASIPQQRPRARCPRCEYDLSGTVETWKGAPPPTEGTCSECGLRVVWAKVLAEPVPPRWFVEGSPHFSLWRATLTAFMIFRPIAFWKRVELAHRVRLWRPTLMLAALLTAVIGGRVALQAIVGRFPWLEGVLTVTSAPFMPPRTAITPLLYDTHFLLGIVIYGIALPWVLLALSVVIGESLKKAKVRPKHLVRVALYNSMAIPMLIFLFSALGLTATLLGETAWKGVWPAAFTPVIVILEGTWTILYLVYTFVWWWSAYHNYMHLRRAFIGALLMFTCAILATGTCGGILAGWVGYLMR